MRLRLSQAAVQDIDSVWAYTAKHWSPSDADALLDQLEATFHLLARFPGTGRRREELAPGLRSLAKSGFVILYRLHEEVLGSCAWFTARAISRGYSPLMTPIPPAALRDPQIAPRDRGPPATAERASRRETDSCRFRAEPGDRRSLRAAHASSPPSRLGSWTQS